MSSNSIEELQVRLDELLRVAKANELKADSYQQKRLKLIRLESLSSLIEEATVHHIIDFQLSTAVVGLLEESKQTVSEALKAEGRKIEDFAEHLSFHSSRYFQRLFSSSKKPLLNVYKKTKYGELLNHDENYISSVAIMPLIRRGRIFGTLTFGSRNPSRFRPGMGSLFLEEHADLLSICLDNAFLLARTREDSIRDPLTGLFNRRYFDEKALEALKSCGANAPFSLMMLDIDKFKSINDKFGHDVGDIVLREVAALCEQKLSSVGTMCRFGGEEFVCWVKGQKTSDVEMIAESLRETIERHSFNGEKKLKLTISIGMVSEAYEKTDLSGKTLDEILKLADERLYKAKESGRNRVISY